MQTRSSSRVPYILLFILTATALGFHIPQSIRFFHQLEERTGSLPFQLSPRVEAPSPEAVKAGVREGDTLVSVENHPITGTAAITGILQEAPPNRPLLFCLRRQDGTIYTIRLPITSQVPATTGEAGTLFALWILRPLVGILVGVLTAASRPRDRRAWLLLAVLFTFSCFAVDPRLDSAPMSLVYLGNLYFSLASGSWFIWMPLFGLAFPEPLPWDQRHPRMKWLLLGPMAGVVLLVTLCRLLLINHFDLAASILDNVGFIIGPIYSSLGILCISVFFWSLCHKYFRLRDPDARRRLGLVWLGASICLAPLLLLVLMLTLLPSVQPPTSFVLFTLVVLSTFPLFLGYAIVVKKAMDVKVFIREGLRYTLLRGGIRGLQATALVLLLLGSTWLTSRPQTSWVLNGAILTAGALSIAYMRQFGQRMAQLVDRRFFRDACCSEQVLLELMDKLHRLVDEEDILKTMTATLSTTLHIPRVALLLPQGDMLTVAMSQGLPEESEPVLPLEGGICHTVLHSPEPIRVFPDDPESWIYRNPAVTREERDCLTLLDCRLLVPVPLRTSQPGCLCLGTRLGEAPYSRDEIRILQGVATQTALSLENARMVRVMAKEAAQRDRFLRELEIARDVQQRLFPQDLPVLPEVDYAGRCIPAQIVGGDYFDFLALPDRKLLLAIGDISGKGISAALLMASLQASFRGHAAGCQADLAGLVGHLNRMILQSSPINRFATFFVACLDTSTNTLTFVNAGHNPPILVRRERNEIERLEAGGPPLGILEDIAWETGRVLIQPGDILAAYTDGITEAMSPSGEEWGEQTLAGTLIQLQETPRAGDILEGILDRCKAYTLDAPPHDDKTLVILRPVA